jgi:D-sedoheptulose 7-phosphate isomerase
MDERVLEHFRESMAIKQAAQSLAPAIVRAAHRISGCLLKDGKVLACGNGGSAADAQHFTGELLGRFEQERSGLAAVALTTDSSTMTAIANDYDFDDVFSKQVRALGRPGDVLLAISTSGNSANVLKGVQMAHQQGMNVIALTGRNGGEIGDALSSDDVELRVPAERTCRIQEVHILIIHCLCDLIDAEVIDSKKKALRGA